MPSHLPFHRGGAEDAEARGEALRLDRNGRSPGHSSHVDPLVERNQKREYCPPRTPRRGIKGLAEFRLALDLTPEFPVEPVILGSQ